MFLDSVFTKNNASLPLITSKRYHKINKSPRPILFSHGKRTRFFYTENSKLYITPEEQELMERGVQIDIKESRFDGFSFRIINEYRKFRPEEDDFLYRKFLDKYEEIRDGFADFPQSFVRRFSLMSFWNFSLVVAVIIGMVSMTFIYRYLGAGASAEGGSGKVITNAPAEEVLGSEEVKNDRETVEYIEDIIKELDNSKKEEFNKKVEKMVKGYPIEKMLPYILKKDRTVVAFLIGIAKKESGWGEHVPVLDGKDCYNYWGYRGVRKLMGTGGHTCFNSRKDAVDTVSDRIEFLIKERKLDTPAKMSIWKCGSACSKDGQVHNWISDVSLYFDKLN
jgi:hypothetical protein